MNCQVKSHVGWAARGYARAWSLTVAVAFALCGSAAAQQTAPASTSTGAAAHAAAPNTVRGIKPDQAKRRGEPVYQLIGFILNGTDRVDTDALIASLPQHKGDPITHEDIKHDADLIRAALAAKHVHGEMTTATLHPVGGGNKVLIVWDVHPMDALAQLPFPGRRRFGSQTFSGNVKLSQAQLDAATRLKPGQKMPDGSVGDARTGIEQAYDAVFPGKTVGVSGKVILKKDDSVVINWQIAEPK